MLKEKLIILRNLQHFPINPYSFQGSFKDEGESWIWGDYVIIFQKNPPNSYEFFQGSDKTPFTLKLYHKIFKPFEDECPRYTNDLFKEKEDITLKQEWLFAMTIFYKKSVYDSTFPILIYAIDKMIGRNPELTPIQIKSDLQIKEKYRPNKFNIENRESVIKFFFNAIREELSLKDEPLKIGKINDIFGHPETGFTKR